MDMTTDVGRTVKKREVEHFSSLTTEDVRCALLLKTDPNFTGDWYDASCDGLLIRIGTRTAAWYLRGRWLKKQVFLKIKDVTADDTPAAFRLLAIEARLMMKKGDPATAQFLHDTALGGPIIRYGDPAKDGWTWEEARDRFLAHIKTSRREATWDDYRKTLTGPDMKGLWKDTLVKTVTEENIKSLMDKIHARVPGSMADHTLRVVRSCLAWTSQRGESGLKTNPAERVKAPEPPIEEDPDDDGEEDDGWVPTPEQLGTLPWSLNATQREHPSMRLSAMMVLLTAQRRLTVITARHRDFEPTKDGGALWVIPAAYMKSGRTRTKKKKNGKVVRVPPRPHIIPLPPLTWHIVQQAMTLATASETWLFPQLRLRKKGDAGGDHMSVKAPGDAMEAAGSAVRPHGCRRGFGTHGEKLLGILPFETSAILDHAEGRSGVTAEKYALHDGTHFKWPVMRKWEAWVIQQVRDQDPKKMGSLPAFLGWSKCENT